MNTDVNQTTKPQIPRGSRVLSVPCLALILISAGLINAVPLTGVTRMPVSASRSLAQRKDSFAAFWNKFKGAVIKNDRRTVVTLSRFPILRGYGVASIRSSSQLLKKYGEVFSGETNAAKCFQQATPQTDMTSSSKFTVSCSFASGGGGDDPFVYTFTLTRTGWKFIGFENINE